METEQYSMKCYLKTIAAVSILTLKVLITRAPFKDCSAFRVIRCKATFCLQFLKDQLFLLTGWKIATCVDILEKKHFIDSLRGLNSFTFFSNVSLPIYFWLRTHCQCLLKNVSIQAILRNNVPYVIPFIITEKSTFMPKIC